MTIKDQVIVELLADLDGIKSAITLLYLDNPFQIQSPARLAELRVYTRSMHNTLIEWVRESQLEIQQHNIKQED